MTQKSSIDWYHVKHWSIRLPILFLISIPVMITSIFYIFFVYNEYSQRWIIVLMSICILISIFFFILSVLLLVKQIIGRRTTKDMVYNDFHVQDIDISNEIGARLIQSHYDVERITRRRELPDHSLPRQLRFIHEIFRIENGKCIIMIGKTISFLDEVHTNVYIGPKANMDLPIVQKTITLVDTVLEQRGISLYR